MAKGKETLDRTRGRKGTKISCKKPKNKSNSKSNSSNGSDVYHQHEPEEALVVPDSGNEDGDEEDEVADSDNNGDREEGDDDDEEEEDEAKSSGITNQRGSKAKNGDGKGKSDVKKKGKNKNGKSKKSESDDSHCFPMHRISRIIKSEDSDIRITQEAVFLINKATEKFLELFCKEAYACSFLDRKNQVWYEHLSSVVSTRKRFDFLSDFVPEKVKAEDALAETSVAET